MSLCKKCGFISYPNKYKTHEEIKHYYRNEYRGGPPTHGNFVTGTRKLTYHAHFLKEVFSKWQDTGLTAPVIGECGSAIGMVLHWFKRVLPQAKVFGSDLTTTFKNVAAQEFGVEITDDFDLTRKYDLIMSYKVAEHQLDVDLRIREYAEALNEGGYLYISVPTWFNALHNSGIGGFDLEYYYHTDHINVWTRILFEEILRKSGFVIIKIDRLMYGDTYLCKRDDSVMQNEPQYEKPEEIKAALARIKRAFDCMKTQKANQALAEWGNFPIAWACYYEQNRQQLHDKFKGNGLELADYIYKEMSLACGPILDAMLLKADIIWRYGQLVPAIQTFEDILDIRPNDTKALFSLAQCFRALSEQESDNIKKTKLLLTARDICRKIMKLDELARPEAFNWALRDEASMDPRLVSEILKAEYNQKTQAAVAVPQPLGG